MLRTIEENATLGEQWKNAGAKKANMNQFYNCIGVPIVSSSSDTKTYVIDKFGIPTLHCILGTCNRLYHYLEDNCPDVEKFSKKLGIVKDPFQNKDYNGNYVEKILKNLEELNAIVDPEYKPFIEALQAIKDVQDCCFKPVLKPNYQEAINRFETAWYNIYIEFEIPFSNKCHVIIDHIPQVIERTGKSLYMASEQVVEATHAKFDMFWQRYKVNDVERQSHGVKLFACVGDFNSKYM